MLAKASGRKLIYWIQTKNGNADAVVSEYFEDPIKVDILFSSLLVQTLTNLSSKMP